MSEKFTIRFKPFMQKSSSSLHPSSLSQQHRHTELALTWIKLFHYLYNINEK